MAAADSRRGHQRERDLVRILRSDGWIALRAPASLGVADVIAVRNGEIRLIEVKSTRAGAYAGFPPASRKALLDAANTAGGEAWLYWHPPRKKPQWISPDQWPPL